MPFTRSVTAIVAVLVAHALGLVGMYWIYQWYDTPMHFLGGFAAGALALDAWYFFVSDIRLHLPWMRPWMVRLAFVIGIVSLIGVLWELHDGVLDIIRHRMLLQPSVADTMKDLTMDLIGGFAAYAFFGNAKS